jgi:hypothetical protein
VVDAHGHPLSFTLSKANRNDVVQLLETVDGIRIGKRRRRPMSGPGVKVQKTPG